MKLRFAVKNLLDKSKKLPIISFPIPDAFAFISDPFLYQFKLFNSKEFQIFVSIVSFYEA